MKDVYYPFASPDERRYYFTSEGKKRIYKMVEFTTCEYSGLVNIGFGDAMANGSYDDSVISDNGDGRKVIVTVIHIILRYTSVFEDDKIIFTGSSPARTKLYARILRNYLADFQKQFVISGITEKNNFEEEIIGEPSDLTRFVLFFIKRKKRK